MVHQLREKFEFLRSLALLFSFRVQSLVDMAEKFPVQEQVDNEQGGKYQTGVIMHGHPLVFGYPKVRQPAAASPATFRKHEIQDKPGNERRDERDKAADVHKCVDGNAFHDKPQILSGLCWQKYFPESCLRHVDAFESSLAKY
jgi:hypothetical protein